MNRAFILATLALTLTGGSVSRAAEKPQAAPSAPAVLENAPKGTVVFNDDGGRSQIIPRQAAPEREVTYHGGPVVSRGTVQALFLGSGWRERGNREKESEVMDALRQDRSATFLARYGVKAWESPGLPLEDPADPVAGRRISDLDIQARLEGLVNGASPLDAGTVFIVFLAPGLGSTLGGVSETSFTAYHNHFHIAAGVVRYVVVPYDSDRSRWLAAARQSLNQALINPEGNAWY